MDVHVKEEPFEPVNPRNANTATTTRIDHNTSVIELSSSDSEDDVTDAIESIIRGSVSKKQKLEKTNVVLPVGFLDPLTLLLESSPSTLLRRSTEAKAIVTASGRNSKQFWKAGDCYEEACSGGWDSSTVGMDHVRVHPKFLHSNATSHKWALGAFAELLDNALDEIYSGATYVNIDVLQNKKDEIKMLLIEDNGGGMDPDKMRQCMSLGYSVKSKIANTIGQYGNGFKTSTMRLGADVIVFSRSCGKGGKSPTQSIGLLSYTFLRSTGKEDIVVPMLDYERGGEEWNKMTRLTHDDWNKNVETIVQWSPFSNEADLLRQFNLMKDHGTRIIIYNLWEDDQGMLELDLVTEKHDILLRGANRDEKNIQMANEFPNSRHFLTYRHSLRSYASILYLRLPPGFRIILRGKDVLHHNSVNDMMLSQEVTYRPQPGSGGVPKDTDMLAVVNIGFVKDAKHHIDVQGFNVYHKNRLIKFISKKCKPFKLYLRKPFWRLWNSTGSDGRGVIGVLEANFVEPAHDKQGFERTTVLARLEAKLIQMQKTYWRTYCHKIGYAPRNHKNLNDSYRETSPDYILPTSSNDKNRTKRKQEESFGKSSKSLDGKHGKGHMPRTNTNGIKGPGKRSEMSSPSSDDNSNEEILISHPERQMNGSNQKTATIEKKSTNTNRSSFNTKNTQGGESGGMHIQTLRSSLSKGDDLNRYGNNLSSSNSSTMDQLRKENCELIERLKEKEDEISNALMDLQREKERCKLLETQLEEAQRKLEDLNREQESFIDIFSEERNGRDVEEENLRKKLKAASETIQELRNKARK